MATPEATIPVLLGARLADLSLAPAVPIAWPEMSFAPPADQSPYLEVRYFPNTTTREFVGSSEPHTHVGLYQITVVAPRGRGLSEALEIAGHVVDHFPADLRLWSESPALEVVVSSRPSVAAPLTDDRHLRVPVTVAWRSRF